jgi:methylated-DNA-[protein]-cysteine S-methyltransferase
MMSEIVRFLFDRVDTPLGPLTLVAAVDERLRSAGWDEPGPRLRRQLGALPFALEAARDPFGFSSAFAAYFDGDLSALEGLPVDAEGTPFQLAVWRALRSIPCGETRSYGEIAQQIGKPAASRAVGMANNANPVGVAVPCHRVIGADGSLTGYGGGIERKRWLLAHEGKLALPLAGLLGQAPHFRGP